MACAWLSLFASRNEVYRHVQFSDVRRIGLMGMKNLMEANGDDEFQITTSHVSLIESLEPIKPKHFSRLTTV